MQIQKDIQVNNCLNEQQQCESQNFGKFSIFLLIKTSHHNYGIKNTDYQRYRKYCSNKIGKLRKSIGFKLGNKNKFIKKDNIKQNINNHKILQYTLYNCQKYWAQSNQTKYSSKRKQSQKSRSRFYSIKKLKKSIQWSNKLTQICQQKCDYTTKLQSTAYKYYLQGMLLFQKLQWNQSQIKLITAREIMTDIKKKSDTLSQAIFKQKIDQLDQTIKFCNFKISKGKDMPISQIIQMKKLGDGNLSSLIQNLTQQRLTQISLEQTDNKQIRFQQQRYTIKQQKILIQKNKIDLEIKTLQQIKINSLNNIQDQQIYQELLTFYSNVVVLIQQAIKLTDQQRQDGKKTDKYTQGQLQILKKIYIHFQRLKITIFIDRNFTIFRHSYNNNKGRKSTPQTLAKLLTATINNFTNLIQIIRQKDSHSLIQLQYSIQQIQQKVFYLRTLRLLFVGQVYFNNLKLKQAYSLWNQCQRCLNILLSKQQMKNIKQKKQQQQDFIKCNLVSLDKIQKQLKIFKLKSVIHNYKIENNNKNQLNQMFKQINIKNDNQNKNININNINNINMNMNMNNVTLEQLVNNQNIQNLSISLQKISEIDIIQLPGNLQLLPTRPIFFDIFETQINYPNLQNKTKQNSKGWSGWFKKVFK